VEFKLLVCFGRRKTEGMSGRCRSMDHKEDGRSSGCSGGGRRHKAVACPFAARRKNQREDGVAAGLLD
jgi:hypothetical protein